MVKKSTMTPQDFEENLKKQKLGTIVDTIDRSYGDIVGEKVNGKLPENLFVQHFLPFFTGQVPSKDVHQYYQYWIGVAGTPMNEVDIIDGKGETIFTVPPIMNSDFVNPAKRSKGMGDVFAEHSLHASHSPASGERFLANELSQRINEFEDNTEKLVTAEQKWNHIFKRYGVESPYKNEATQEVRSNNDNDDDGEDLIYD